MTRPPKIANQREVQRLLNKISWFNRDDHKLRIRGKGRPRIDTSSTKSCVICASEGNPIEIYIPSEDRWAKGRQCAHGIFSIENMDSLERI